MAYQCTSWQSRFGSESDLIRFTTLWCLPSRSGHRHVVEIEDLKAEAGSVEKYLESWPERFQATVYISSFPTHTHTFGIFWMGQARSATRVQTAHVWNKTTARLLNSRNKQDPELDGRHGPTSAVSTLFLPIHRVFFNPIDDPKPGPPRAHVAHIGATESSLQGIRTGIRSVGLL